MIGSDRAALMRRSQWWAARLIRGDSERTAAISSADEQGRVRSANIGANMVDVDRQKAWIGDAGGCRALQLIEMCICKKRRKKKGLSVTSPVHDSYVWGVRKITRTESQLMWGRDARQRVEICVRFLGGRNCAAYPTLQQEAGFASEWVVGLRRDFTSRDVVKDIRKAPAARNWRPPHPERSGLEAHRP